MNSHSILAECEAASGDVIALRRRLHRHPELGLELPRTQAAVLDALRPLGLSVQVGERLSSVVARLEGAAPGPAILLRADMDALPLDERTGLEFSSETPGAMHACGHDAHTAMLVGAARVLAAHRERIAGSVVLMFQPGEEGHHGARVMLEEGLEQGNDLKAAFALHVTPRFPAGTIAVRAGAAMASMDTFSVVIHGRGGHASAPHDCLDPIPIACELVTTLQTLVTRRVSVFEPAVLTVGKIEAGTSHHIIPETARLWGTVRTLSETTRQRVLDGIRHLAEGIAAAHGARAEVTIEHGYPVLLNDPGVSERVLGLAADSLGESRAVRPPHAVMGAEDFAYVLQRVPGCMANLGTRPPTGPAPPNHSNRMLLEESALAVGVFMHVAFALDHLAADSLT